MRRFLLSLLLTGSLLWTLHAQDTPLRVAVIGGMTMSGMWEQVATAFTRRTGIAVTVVATGPKQQLDAYCRSHPVDLVTMHSSDTIVDLVADGLFEALHPWTRNAQMLVGDRTNPGEPLADALQKIVDRESPFVLHASGGTFEVFNTLRQRFGFRPHVVFTPKKRGFLDDATRLGGYSLYGVIPFLMHKQHHPQIQGYVIDDPALRRPYLAAVAASAHTDAKQHARAEMLHRFLRSNEAQSILAAFRLPGHPRIPIFYPLTSDIHPDKGVTYVP